MLSVGVGSCPSFSHLDFLHFHSDITYHRDQLLSESWPTQTVQEEVGAEINVGQEADTGFGECQVGDPRLISLCVLIQILVHYQIDAQREGCEAEAEAGDHQHCGQTLDAGLDFHGGSVAYLRLYPENI